MNLAICNLPNQKWMNTHFISLCHLTQLLFMYINKCIDQISEERILFLQVISKQWTPLNFILPLKSNQSKSKYFQFHILNSQQQSWLHQQSSTFTICQDFLLNLMKETLTKYTRAFAVARNSWCLLYSNKGWPILRLIYVLENGWMKDRQYMLHDKFKHRDSFYFKNITVSK